MSHLPKPEKRNTLTRLQFAKLALQQMGKCGCGCGRKLDFDTPRAITDEHLQPLDQLGTNELSNRALWCTTPCAKNKTKADNSRAAKGKRIRGETCTKPRGRKLQSRSQFPKGRKLQSRPFPSKKNGSANLSGTAK